MVRYTPLERRFCLSECQESLCDKTGPEKKKGNVENLKSAGDILKSQLKPDRYPHYDWLHELVT
jgi:hypothetical protein